MNWLDATTGEGPGSLRGPCDGSQIDLSSSAATNAEVTFGDIRWGEIGSTVPTCKGFNGGSSSTNQPDSTEDFGSTPEPTQDPESTSGVTNAPDMDAETETSESSSIMTILV